MDPFPADTPLDRYDLVLRPESADPAGLEQEIADLIRRTVTRLGLPAAAEWADPDPAERSSKAVAVEARVYHTIDEIATDNAERVAAWVAAPARVSWAKRLLARLARPFHRRPDVDTARRRVEAAVEQCVCDGIGVSAAVTEAAVPANDAAR